MIRPNTGALGELPLGGDPLGQIANNQFMPPALTQVASAVNQQPDIVGGEGDDVLMGAGSELTAADLDTKGLITTPKVSPSVSNAIEKFVTGSGKPKETSTGYMTTLAEYMKPDEPTGSFASLIGRDPKAAFYYTLLRGGLGTMQAAGTPGATGMGSVGAGMGAGIDATVKMQAAYDAAQQKRKTAKLAAMQAAATHELATQKAAFQEQKGRVDTGIKLQELAQGETRIELTAKGTALRIKELAQKHANFEKSHDLKVKKLNHDQEQDRQDGLVTYYKFDANGDIVDETRINPKDPASAKALKKLEDDKWTSAATAKVVFDRKTEKTRQALAQSSYDLRMEEFLYKKHEDTKKNQKPFYKILQDEGSPTNTYIETKWARPGSEEATKLLGEGFNTADALNLQDKLKPETNFEVLAKFGPDGYESRVVNVKDENSFQQAVADGFDRSLGPLTPETDGHVMVFDTKDGRIKTYSKSDPGYAELQDRMKKDPSRYQLLSKTRLTDVKGLSATQRDKLSGQWFTMRTLLDRVNKLSGAVVDNPQLVGSSGAALNTLQNIRDSISSLAQAFFGDAAAQLRIGETDTRTGKMFTQSDAYEERAMMQNLTDPAAIRASLSNNIEALRKEFDDPDMGISRELVELVQLETELAYALARMQKPSEKINKSDIETFRNTYSLMRLSKGSKTSKATLLNIGEKLNQGMQDLEKRLGPDFKPYGEKAPKGTKVWDTETRTYRTQM